MILAAFSAHAQNLGTHIDNMREALVPYGEIKGANCHKVEIDLIGPWGDYGIPDGVNKQKPDEFMWAFIKIDTLRVFVDLAVLDEDKVMNHAIFSTRYISEHQRGTEYVADTPAVMIHTGGLNEKITVETVDLKKLNALNGKENVPESQMGITLDQKKAVMILFTDKEHADAFEKALKKAIVICKAQ